MEPVSTCICLVTTIKCIYETVKEASDTAEDVRELAHTLRAVQPILEEIANAQKLPESVGPVLELLAVWVGKAQEFIDKYLEMSKCRRMFFAKLIYEELEAIKTGLNQGVAGLQLVNLQVSDGISAQLDLVAHRLSSWQVRQEQSLDQIVGLLERQNTSFAYVMDKLGSLEGSLLNMGLSRCMRDINRSRRYRDLSEPQMQALDYLEKVCTDIGEALRQLWINPDDIELQDRLGEGSSGQVYRALVRGEPAAVKLVPLHCQPGVEDQLLQPSVQGLSTLLESDDQRVAALRRELAVIVRGWQKLEHVCNYLGVTMIGGKPGIVMEYYERGSLAEEIFRRNEMGLDMEESLSYSSDILAGLQELHEAGILMLDLKPHNVLLTAGGRAVLTDFGLARALQLDATSLGSMTGGHGTYEYMAPEQFTGEKGIRPQTDMWGFGATLVHMLSGRRPFPSLPSWQVMHKVMSEQQHPELPFKVEAHPAVKDLLQRCFDRDPTLRPSAAEALQVVQEVLGTFLPASTPTSSQPSISRATSVADSEAVNEHLVCPICMGMLQDPVLLVESGITYCERCITQWLERGQMRCPATGRQLATAAYVVNLAVKNMLSDAAPPAGGTPRTSLSSAPVPAEPSKPASQWSPSPFSNLSSQTLSQSQRQSQTMDRVNSATSLHSLGSSLGSKPSFSSKPRALPARQPSMNVLMPQSDAMQRGLVKLASAPATVQPEPRAQVQKQVQQDQEDLEQVLQQCRGPNRRQGLQWLMQLLKSTSPEVQQQAAAGVCTLLVSGGPAMQSSIASCGAVGPLLRLLQPGSLDGTKEHAAAALAGICKGNPASQNMVAAAGAAPVLVQLVEVSTAPGVQEKAAYAVECLADGHSGNQAGIAAAGALDALVPLLEPGTVEQVQAAAASALAKLAAGETNNQSSIAAAGGIHLLVALLHAGNPAVVQERAAEALAALCAGNANCQAAAGCAGAIDQLVQLVLLTVPQLDFEQQELGAAGPMSAVMEQAARALHALAHHHTSNQELIVSSGGTGALVQLLQPSRSEEVQAQAAQALASLGEANTQTQTQIVSAGAIPLLVQLVQQPKAPDELLEHAARALALLVLHNASNQASAVAAGAIPGITDLLKDGQSVAVKKQAAVALANLCMGNEANQASIAAAGVVAPLVKLLSPSCGDDELREQVAGAMAWLCSNHSSNKAAFGNAGAIPALVQMLLTGVSPAAQSQAARALANMADGHVGNQGTIAAAGGVQALTKLAESDNSQLRLRARGALQSLKSVSNLAAGSSSMATAGSGKLERGGSQLLVLQQSQRRARQEQQQKALAMCDNDLKKKKNCVIQ